MRRDDLYNSIDFKDKNTLKQLLYLKAQFSSTNFSSRSSAYDRNEPNQILYTDIMLVYTDLDSLIEEAKLTDKNMRLLRMVMSGYTISYIYSNFENYNKKATSQMFNRILEKLIETQRKKEEVRHENQTP